MYCTFPRWSTGSCFAFQDLGLPMDLDVRSACRLLHNILLYISSIVRPTYSWVYQIVHKSPALISTIHLYQQPIINQANIVGFIRPSTITHALISIINDHFQVHDLLWIPRHIIAQHLLLVHLYAD